MSEERRVSRVVKIRDFPAGTRDRGWGYLHDQVWFYVDKSEAGLLSTLKSMAASCGVDEIRATPRVDGNQRFFVSGINYGLDLDEEAWHRYRRFEQGWMRLYLDRRILWTPWRLFRLHTFYAGDDDSAPHDHPSDFWTFPLSEYLELVSQPSEKYENGVNEFLRPVRRFRWHYRPATYRHVVQEPDRPFRTLCVFSRRRRKWGFWPEPDRFVPYEEWTAYD